MNELNRREYETLLQHAKRLVEYKFVDRKDYDYVEIYKAIFDIEISSTEARKRLSGLRDLFEKLDLSHMSNFDENDLLKEIEEKTMVMQMEKKKMQDQRRELKKYVDSQARFKHLLETMKECVDELNATNPITYKPRIVSHGVIEDSNEGVLICSDWHIGAKFENALGKYNYDIANNRIEELLANALTYCSVNNVTTLHVELLGDMMSGLIHVSSKVEAEEDAVSQLMTLCDLLSHFIKELSYKIDKVNIYTAIGNHSRLCPNIKENQEGENFERLIPYFLKHRLDKLTNVTICEEANIDDCILTFDVCDTKVFGVHGDLDKPSDVVDNMIKMFKVIPDEIHMGHYHTDMEKTEYDIETIVNGSLQGTDTFAKKIRKSGKPLQKLRIYNENGCVCEYKIRLK